MILEATVQGPSNISFSDGDDIKLRSGKTGELMVMAQHGNNYANTYRGNTFHAVSETPLAIPIKTTTTPKFILWNPYGSGINCTLIHYCLGYATGDNVAANIMLGVIPNAGSWIRTGGPISAFATEHVHSGLLGAGEPSRVLFSVAATIVAATHFLPLGMSMMLLDITKSSSTSNFYDFGGTVIVPPGCAVFSCASAATVATYNERLSWYEYPT
jgi:hypothetical protein